MALDTPHLSIPRRKRPCRPLLAGACLALLWAGAALAAEEDQPEIFPSGKAPLIYSGQLQGAAEYAITSEGPLLNLRPIAGLLGIQLQIGPYGDSNTLLFRDRRFVTGPGDASFLEILGDAPDEQKILPLSRRPHKTLAGLHVPLDFLDQTFGEQLNLQFTWDEQALELRVAPRELRELAAAIDLVHQFGLTTVEIRFNQKPRYRVEERDGAMEIQLLGDRLLLPVALTDTQDPLVAGIDITSGRLVVRLVEGAGSARPRLLDSPPRLILEVFRQTVVPSADGNAAPTPTLEPADGGLRTIVLDPGHGGEESGAVGPSGTEEKDLVLQVALALEQELERRLPVRVELTRRNDVDLPLERRTAIANQNKADLFISLHFNASFGNRAHGAETYFLSREASDQMAADAAAIENRNADGQTDPELDLKLILWDLAQSYHLAESQRFARLVQKELNETLGLRDRGVKQAPFLVLMGANMPAVLVELGFLSNPKEEARLQEASYRRDLVDALVRAVRVFKNQLDNTPDTSGDGDTP